MDKLNGQDHQKFFNSFIKITVITCLVLTVLLGGLYFFLVV